MVTNKYVQLTNYALLEYIYADELISLSSAGFYRIDSSYQNTNKFQILNLDNAVTYTNNVRDTNSVKIGNNRWVYLDIDNPISYLAVDNNLNYTDITSLLSGATVKYDTVRLHILAGYNLEDLDGLILETEFRENNDVEKYTTVANYTLLKGNLNYTINNLPIFITDRIYDKYVEIKIPSLKIVNQEFTSNLSAPNTAGYQWTTNNKGFKPSSLIRFTLHEIASTSVDNSFKIFYTDHQSTVSINQVDTYSPLAAVIQESTEGDYFEYYPTWFGTWVDDFVAELESVSGDYAVIHNIRVLEQVGVNFIETKNFTEYQTDSFTGPRTFRPVLEFSDEAVTFSIEYTMRFLNRQDGSQIIRVSSVTSTNVKKYGKNIAKVQINNQVFKVYNKVVEGVKISLPSYAERLDNPVLTKIYVPSFFQLNKIKSSSSVVYTTTEGKVVQESSKLDDIVFPQTKLKVFINPFDNWIKFKVYKEEDNSVPIPLDFSMNQAIFLTFIDDNGEKVYVQNNTDTNLSNPKIGEVIFKLQSDLANKVIKYKNKNYYLISKTDTGDESVMYSGTTDIEENREKWNQEVIDSFKKPAAISERIIVKEVEKIVYVDKPVAVDNNTSTTSTTAATTSQDQNAINGKPKVISTQNIPGLNDEESTTSIKNGIRPKGRPGKLLPYNDNIYFENNSDLRDGFI